MKRLWIHIGMHKTGTTSVQSNLAHATHQDDWCILTSGGRPNMGMAIYAMFASEPHKFHLFVKKGLSEAEVADKGARLRRKIHRQIRKSDKQTFILSGEAACLVDAAGIKAMKDFFAPLFDEIRVIGYVRPPAGYKTSIFQQHLKYGACPLDFSKIEVSYRRKFEKFDQVFGRENVLLCKFDPETFEGGCIVADFCTRIGIRPPPPESVRRVNEGMTREACSILYAWRKFGPGVEKGRDYIRENNRMVAPLLVLSGSKFRVSRELMDAGSESLAVKIRWMEKRLGQSLDERYETSDGAITSEADLLTITRESCEEYRLKFQEIHAVYVPMQDLPVTGPVDPVLVAELVESCRHASPAAPTSSVAAESGLIAGYFKKLMNRSSGPEHLDRPQ